MNERLQAYRRRTLQRYHGARYAALALALACAVLLIPVADGLVVPKVLALVPSIEGDPQVEVGLTALCIVVVGVTFWALLEEILRRLVLRAHQRTLGELRGGNLALTICSEYYIAMVCEVLDATPLLKWISPPPPHTFEQLIEFGACYHRALQRLSYGPGHLGKGAVARGSWRWLLTQAFWDPRVRRYGPWCLLGVFLFPPLAFLLVLMVPILFVLVWPAGGAIAQRLGIEGAYVDFFLEEGAQPDERSPGC